MGSFEDLFIIVFISILFIFIFIKSAILNPTFSHAVSNDYTHVTANGVLHVKNCSSGMHDRVFRCVAAVGNWSVVSVERRIQVIGK